MPKSIGVNSAKAITGLFKYFPPDKLDFFEKHLVLLTPPKYLNDPWDFLPKGRTLTNKEIIRTHQKIEKKAEFAHLQPKELLEIMRNEGKSPEFREGLPKFSQEYVSLTHGIVSFTEKPSCRLMWAHYAASHTGFVAEFAATAHFERPKDKLDCCFCIGNPVAKVKYPAQLKPCVWTPDNMMETAFLKHPLWKYEQEWRILLPLNDRSVRHCKDQERYCLPFSPQQLIRVIFGMRMDQEVQQRLCLMLNQNEFKNVQKQSTHIDNETGELILKPYLKPHE